MLNPKSLLMIITFHSLEEKLVSQKFTIWRKNKVGEWGTKKPLEPNLIELEENSKSSSAKLYSFILN